LIPIKRNLIVVLLSLATACSNIKHLPENPGYNSDSVLKPELFIYHSSETESELYFSVSSKELLYTRQLGSTDFTTQLLVNYRLTNENHILLDSASLKLVDINNSNSDKYLSGKIPFKAAAGKNYTLNVTIRDINRKSVFSTVLSVEKSSQHSRQNFMCRYSTGSPFFKTYTTGEDSLYLISKRPDKLFVKFFKNDFPLAPPPFSISNKRRSDFHVDSAFVLQAAGKNIYKAPILKEGFYHFQSDSSQTEGYTLFRFSDGYPEISTPEELIPPLRYITSKEEFEHLTRSKDKKAASDEFWLEASGSKERARSLIRKFYNRVQEANESFTSYMEGWKTDRGMIYIIYGPPISVYKNAFSETWTYREDKNYNSYTFTFVKSVNPFSDNDFLLERSEVYKNSWYNALDYWRRGRLYFDR
jgi:GWxTD domain-containing protein